MPRPSLARLGLLLATLLLAAPARAEVLAGVDYRPYGRADLAWVTAGSLSGTRAAEGDGVLTPPLTAWVGPANRRNAYLFGLAAVYQRSASWTGTAGPDDTNTTRRRVGSVRPSFDWRRYLVDREDGRPLPWLSAGAYGVIPFARYKSEAWTEEEQAAWDEVAREDRARIGAFGFRAGGGLEIMWPSGLVIGARHLFVLHRAQALDEDTYTATVLVESDTAVSLGFAFR